MNDKLKTIAASILFLGIMVGGVNSIRRDSDELYLMQPAENAIVVGESNIQWFVKDSDQLMVPVQLDVFSLSCSNNGDYYATITDNIQSYVKNAANTYSYSWNTQGQLKNKASIDDGQYCLRACAIMQQGSSYNYSLCDTRTISIQNNNRTPEILSTLEKLDYALGDTFAYQINARDLNGDTLLYSLVSGPSFIVVNQNSGQVTSSGRLTQTGSYIIKLRVTDSKGAFAEQVFTINVGSSLSQYNLKVVKPAVNEIIKDNTTTIQWTIDNTSGITGYTIYYSKDAVSWDKVGEAAASSTSFSWNISDIGGGDYYVKLQAARSNGEAIISVSDKFSIDRSTGSIPLISSVQPLENSLVSSKRPELGATFTISDNKKLNVQQTLFSLDDSLVTDCVKTDNSIKCQLFSDLQTGRHKAKVVVVDSLNKSNTKEWFFEVTGSSSSTDNTSSGVFAGINAETLKTIGIALCAGLAALLLVIVVIMLIRRAKRNADEDQYTNPLPQNSDDSSDYTNQIGSYTVTTDYQIPSAAPEVVTVEQPIATVPTGSAQMPSSYTSDEIPDWLKSLDGDKPISISSSGQTEEYKTDNSANNIDAASQPHE